MTEIDVYRPGQLDTVQDRAVQRIADWAHAADAAYAIATKLVQSSFVPVAFRGKAVEATAAILAGAEVGISPMSALRAFDVIQGVAAPRAITLRAIAQSFGHDIEITETNSTRCTVRGRRKGGERWQSLSWTIDRARDLGLLGKDQWKKQPAAMLIARATAEMARLIAADAILGIGYSAEEVADGTTDEPAATEPTPGVRRMSRTPKAEPIPEPDQVPDEPAPEAPESDDPTALDPITRPQLTKLHATFGDLGYDRDKGLAFIAEVLGFAVESSKELTKEEASRCIDAADRKLADHA